MALEATREKVKALEVKLRQAKVLVQKQEAIANHKALLKAGEESRREDTRKKILIGAYMLTTLDDEEIQVLYADMQTFLKGDDEKRLFMTFEKPLVAVG
jgi:hypothetical protein